MREPIPVILRNLLSKYVDSEDIDQWWKSPNKIFHGKSPKEAFAEDSKKTTEMLFQEIYKIRTGEPI